MQARSPVQISTVSNRADLISGGDALVRVSVPGDFRPSLRVGLNGHDVTKAFTAASDGSGLGLLSGLRNGRNVVTATLPTVTAPDWSSPTTRSAARTSPGRRSSRGRAATAARDPQCNQKPTYTYSYVDHRAAALQTYDPSNPPPTIRSSSTTTTDGVTVPFIVPQETGYIDRDQYAIAALWQPEQAVERVGAAEAVQPPLVITHGASCDTTYAVGQRADVTDRPEHRSAAASSSCRNALDNAGHNCNIVTQAESLMMTKEYASSTTTARCAGRSAAAAPAARSCSSRSPTPTPASTRASRRSAASPTRGRRPCSTSTT